MPPQSHPITGPSASAPAAAGPDAEQAAVKSPAGTRPRCRRPSCRARFTRRTPGQSYCGPRCRKADLEAVARGRQGKDVSAGQTPFSGTESVHETDRAPLGSKATEFRAPSDQGFSPETAPSQDAIRGERARERETQRYASQRTLWQITKNRSCAACGRAATDPDTGVVLAGSAEGFTVTLGLITCGSIWLCPVCQAKIRHGRAVEAEQGIVTHVEAGGLAMMVTLTARHTASHDLDDLMCAIQGTRADPDKGVKRRPGAYQRLFSGAAWAGDARRGTAGHRAQLGILGYIRATEITCGVCNGSHPHIHAVILFGAELAGPGEAPLAYFTPSDGDVKAFQDHVRSVWTRFLARVNAEYTPSDEHGVQFDPIVTARDAAEIGRYVAKIQEGKTEKSPGNELTRADLKSGRDGNMAPFEVLARIGDLMGGVDPETAVGHGDLAWCLNWWAQYEQATKGRRAIEWSRGLRSALGLDGGDTAEDDVDLALADDAAQGELVTGVRMPAKTWHKVCARGLNLEVKRARDAGGIAAVLALLGRAGISAAGVEELSAVEIGEARDALAKCNEERRERAAQRRAADRIEARQ